MTATDITLADALKLEAGSELDRLMAERVMRWPEWGDCGPPPTKKPYYITLPDTGNRIVVTRLPASPRTDTFWSPSTDLNDAMEALEYVAQGIAPNCRIRLTWQTDRKWRCEIDKAACYRGDTVDHWHGCPDAWPIAIRTDTVPLAICRACLVACWEKPDES